MHPKEAKKEKVGTGRMAHLSLPNSSLIIDSSFDQNNSFLKLHSDPNYEPYVLYPGQTSHNLSEKKLNLKQDKKLLIYIIDGTWPCAKSMMRDSLLLQNIPRVSFNSTKISQFAIKKQPASYCLSTIEAVAYTIDELKLSEIESCELDTYPLHDQLRRLVEYQINAANDDTRPSYRKKSNRPYQFGLTKQETYPGKKRSICFK